MDIQSTPIIEFSPNRSSIAQALLKAQGALRPLVKRADNTYYGSKYCELVDYINASRDALQAGQIVLIQGAAIVEDSVNVETTLLHAPSCEWVRTVLKLKPATTDSKGRPLRGDAQAIGSCITYGKRYALASMLGLAAAGEDDDANNGVGVGSNGDDLSDQRDQGPEQSANGGVAPRQGQAAEMHHGDVQEHVEGGEWIEGQLGEAQTSETDLSICWVKVGDQSVWTRDAQLIKSLVPLTRRQVSALTRSKRAGSYQLLDIQAAQ